MKFWLIFIMAFIFCSCQHVDENIKPANLVPRDTMVNMITELAILNSAKNYNRRILEETGLHPEEYVYGKYKIDSSRFRKSTEYYAKNYTEYEVIYNKVKNKLDSMKDVYQKLEDKEADLKRMEIEKRSVSQDTLGYNKVRLET